MNCLSGATFLEKTDPSSHSIYQLPIAPQIDVGTPDYQAFSIDFETPLFSCSNHI